MNMVYEKTIKELSEFRKVHFLKPKSDENKIRVYLAGSMEFSPEDNFGTKWRNEITEKLDKKTFSIFNPANEVKVFAEEQKLKESIGDNFNIEKIRKQFKRIVKIDLYEVLRSDIVLCKWSNTILSSGTPGEITVAKMFDVPVLIVVNDPTKTSKWTIGCSDNIVTSFENISDDMIKMVGNNVK